MKPKGLDLCCCEGACSEGYARAGFDMYGVDLFKHKSDKGQTVGFSQKRYPYPSHQGDAVEALRTLLVGGVLVFEKGGEPTKVLDLLDFAFIHASPPCQKWSITNHNGREYADLIGPLRELLIQTGLPYVIENVVGAPLEDPIELCGCMFDLKAVDDDGIVLHMWRQRQFESNVPLEQPRPGVRKLRGSTLHVHDEAFHDYEWVGGSYGGARRDKYEAKYVRKGGYVPSFAVQQKLLGIDWMTEGGMHQAVPPIFAEFIGKQVLDLIDTNDRGMSA